MLLGRLGADPEHKTLPGGKSAARLSLATSENWTDKEGQKQERTEWHRCVVYGKLADVCSKHLQKGSQVYLEGKIQTRSWDGKDGEKKYTTEIIVSNVVFLGGKEKGDKADSPSEDGWG